MIYRLGTPVFFAGLVLGFLVASVVHAWVQRELIQRLGGPSARWLIAPRAGLGRYVDPFGAIAAFLGLVGWATPVESGSHRRSDRWRISALILSGSMANVALSAAAFGWLGRLDAPLVSPTLGGLLRGHVELGAAGPTLLYGVGWMNLLLGLVSLVPLPPLDGGRIMFLFAPRTLGWQRAEYYLVERNYGVAAALLLTLLPIGAGGTPLLTWAITSAAQPIASAFAGLAAP